jgi:hypothetical protein
VEIRVPHPLGRNAVNVAGGTYLPDREIVRLEAFTGHAEITLTY